VHAAGYCGLVLLNEDTSWTFASVGQAHEDPSAPGDHILHIFHIITMGDFHIIHILYFTLVLTMGTSLW